MENEKKTSQSAKTNDSDVVSIEQHAGDNSTQVVAINSTVTINNTKYELANVNFKHNDNSAEATITANFDEQHKGSFDVVFSDLWQLEKLSKEAKQVLRKYGCEAEFGQWVKRYIINIGGEHYSLMAKSLLDSCKLNSTAEPSAAAKNKIKGYINGNGVEKFCVFLSAITSIEKQNTIEYYAAKYINYALDKCGIGVFWWENDELNDEQWFVSSKIATGLALSSIFVCLAYDSVQLQSDDSVKFTCFDGDMSPCFKYEYDTYKSFLTACNTQSGNEKSATVSNSPFDEFIKDFSEKPCRFPTARKLRVFSYGSPYNYTGCNAVLNNSNVKIIATNITSNNDIKSKIRTIFKSVVAEIFSIIKEEEGIKKLCPKLKACYLRKKDKGFDKILDRLWKEADRKLAGTIHGERRPYSGRNYSFLYSSFNPQRFNEGEYYDKFLGPEWGDEEENLDWIKDGSKENVEAVPIDYLFQYAIVDESGRNAKNHFLIFPERYNDENGNFKWRIKLVVRDWNLRAVKDDKYRLYLLGKNGYNPKPEMDERFPLSDYSIIEFYKGVSDLSEISNSYLHEYATCQIYSGNRERSEHNTTINSGVENRCAFILYADMLNEIQPTYHLTGFLKLYEAVSPKNSKHFYISLNFYPKPVVYNTRRAKSPSLHKVETRCPYCGRIKTSDNRYQGDGLLASGVGKKKSIDRSLYCFSDTLAIDGESYRRCEYNFIGRFYSIDEYGIIKKGKKVGGDEKVYGNFTGDEFNSYIESDSSKSQNSLVLRNSSGMKALTQDNSKLLYDDRVDDGIVITMVGISQSGKSTFVSRMLSVHSEGNYMGDISCGYLENAMKPYVQSASLMKVKTQEMVKKDGNYPPDTFGINGIRLLEDYKSPKYQEFLPSTQNSSYDPVLTHMPFTVEFRGIQSNSIKKTFMSFFDLPGRLFYASEDMGQKTLPNLHDDYTMLSRSDSIILLLNDVQDDEKALTEMMGVIGSRNISQDTIVAIVFCKADELFCKEQYGWNYIRKSSPVAKDNKFNGSKRQDYIDKCSAEIYGAMTKLGSETVKDIIKKIEEKFNKYKFFATSALGRGDSIIFDEKQDKKYTLYETSPLNIENVLLWIMFEKGIIE